MRVARDIAPEPINARRVGSGRADVVIFSDPERFIEVKAQTKKKSLADITQADWIRDGCHGLRWLNANDSDMAVLLADDLGPLVGKPAQEFADWTLEEAWLADVALLSDEDLLREEELTERSAIRDHMARKTIVLLNQGGAWYGPMANLRPISHVLDGGLLHYRLKLTNKTRVSVPMWTRGAGVFGGIDFTYHLYESSQTPPGQGPMGRHKFHASAFSEGLDHVPTGG